MNNSTPQIPIEGYLIVKVSTARGAIPIEGASVNIRASNSESSDIIYTLVTDSEGKTEKISLPTPPRALSESPGNVAPYALYDIDVFKEGYADLFIHKVPLFGSITAIQPAILIPLPDNRFTDSYDPSGSSSPSDSITGGE
ncbi:MAG: hypothetical protein E7641_02190 [Ruminococcaceae bacterium]|nr:hypothetical protein [Oscillospiraceae bacterium]